MPISAGLGATIGAGVQGIGMLAGAGQANRQYHRQKKLMGVQHKNQMLLNQQGHDLQMDMWNKTNYKAQLEHMKAAGLNPALMYGQAGQGGQTGSQGGGSAASGGAAQENAMDMSNMLTGAHIAKLLEEVEKSKWERGEKGAAEIQSLLTGIDETKANTRLIEANEKYQKVITKIQDASSEAQIKQEFAQLKYTLEQAENVRLENYILNESKEANIQKAKDEAVGVAIGNMLTRAGIKKTEEETRAIGVGIMQKWEELRISGKKVSVEKFRADIDAEYPGVSKVTGKIMNEIYDFASWLDGFAPKWMGGGAKHHESKAYRDNQRNKEY